MVRGVDDRKLGCQILQSAKLENTKDQTLDNRTAPQVCWLGPGPRSTYYNDAMRYDPLVGLGEKERTNPSSSAITRVLYKDE